jgi:PAS domain S-box-containing protein
MTCKPTYKELEKETFLRKQTEEALRASEKKCRTMFESTQEAIVSTDSDGIIISANPAAAKIFGFQKPEELIGSHGSERYADLKQREKLFEELIKKGFVKNYELTFKRADGTLVEILGSATLYRDEQGNIEWVEGFFSDISDRKRAEAALRES